MLFFPLGGGPIQGDGRWGLHLPKPQQKDQLQSGSGHLQTIAGNGILCAVKSDVECTLSAITEPMSKDMASFGSWCAYIQPWLLGHVRVERRLC